MPSGRTTRERYGPQDPVTSRRTSYTVDRDVVDDNHSTSSVSGVQIALWTSRRACHGPPLDSFPRDSCHRETPPPPPLFSPVLSSPTLMSTSFTALSSFLSSPLHVPHFGPPGPVTTPPCSRDAFGRPFLRLHLNTSQTLSTTTRT